MRFNSHVFLFVFLPLVLLGFYVLHRYSRRAALGYVSLASLFFYGYWEPKYLALLVPSLIINYWLGEQLARTRQRGWLIFGLAANLAVIGWFKYSLFLFLTATGGASPPDFLKGIVLPLGISFITFQKIAYLVDIWRGHRKAASFDSFAFFVLFFPQLIAGPIVLYRNIDRQLRRHPRFPAYFAGAFQFGLMIFAIGLFKKVVLADSLSVFADDVFKFSERTDYALSARDAWIGALTYSLQLYFDFSGYSDMAIGLGRMFGLRLPVNFNSPYQATGIIDFWRRWHITLTSFFRNYVYIPMGGNRHGLQKQLLFILVVFFLTGLWHGAGWTFIAWGCAHGLLVVGNHLWEKVFRPRIPAELSSLVPRPLPIAMSRGATLLAVVCLWVVFRATSWVSAMKVLQAMFLISPSTAARVFPDLNLYYVLPPRNCLALGVGDSDAEQLDRSPSRAPWASRALGTLCNGTAMVVLAQVVSGAHYGGRALLRDGEHFEHSEQIYLLQFLNMSARQLATFIACVILAAAACHLAWSFAVSSALSMGYSNRMFDLRRWMGASGRGTPADDPQELVARFMESGLAHAQGVPSIGFFGSSFAFGYPWQESVIFSRTYAALRPDARVLNVSVVGGDVSWINDWVLCSAYRQQFKFDVSILEIPVINTVGFLAEGSRKNEFRHPVKPLGSCRDRPLVHGFMGFVLRRPLGLGWVRFAWDNEAYAKPDQAINIQKVPEGYFVTSSGFAAIEAAYRAQVEQFLRNALSLGGSVYAFPSPVFLPGVTEIGEDAEALRHQFKVTMDACRAIAGVRCLDPTEVLADRGYYYNLTHLNQRGHRVMGEWLAREVAVR